MGKKTAMERVNSHLGYRLLERVNTRFSSMNSGKPVWWFDIPPHMFGAELHLLLAGNPAHQQGPNSRGLIWLRIDANTFSDPQSTFYERPDNGKIQLNISCSLTNQYLCDTTGTGYNFRRHVAKEWPR